MEGKVKQPSGLKKRCVEMRASWALFPAISALIGRTLHFCHT